MRGREIQAIRPIPNAVHDMCWLRSVISLLGPILNIRFVQSRWENLNALAGEIAFSIYKISISKAYGCALYAVAFKGRALMSAIGRGMIGSLGIESHVFSMSHALAAVASIALSCARR